MISEKKKLNNSLLYLLPLVKDEGTNWHNYIQDMDMLDNAYSEDINCPWLVNHVMLLFKSNTGLIFVDRFSRKAEYFTRKYQIKINNKFYVEYIYEIPEEHAEDRLKILDGNVKNISESAKVKIMEFWCSKTNSRIHRALYDNKSVVQPARGEIVPERDFTPDKSELILKLNSI